MSLQDFRELFSGKRDKRRSDDGNCYGFEDVLDGFVIHGEGCPDAGQSWMNSYRCINYRRWYGRYPEWAKVAI